MDALEPTSPDPADAPHALSYSNLPADSTLVFEEHESGITLIDRPRAWLGRHSAAVLAWGMVLVALTFTGLAQVADPGIVRNWSVVLGLAVLWAVSVPVMLQQVRRGRVPGVLGVESQKLIHILPDFRGRMVRREWSAGQIAAIWVVPYGLNRRLSAVAELQILLRPDIQRSIARPVLHVLRGHRADELEWAKAQLKRWLGAPPPSTDVHG